jgi:hypothetical protein
MESCLCLHLLAILEVVTVDRQSPPSSKVAVFLSQPGLGHFLVFFFFFKYGKMNARELAKWFTDCVCI